MQREFLPGRARPGCVGFDDSVERLAVFLFREPDVAFIGDDPRPHGINRVGVHEHPEGYFAQAFFFFNRQLAIRLRPHIEQEVSALRARLDQQANQLTS